MGKVQPSAKREGFATIPDVSWDDVGSLGDVREDLEFSICRPIKYPEEYQVCERRLLTFNFQDYLGIQDSQQVMQLALLLLSFVNCFDCIIYHIVSGQLRSLLM